MVIVILFVLAFVVFRAVNRDNGSVHPEAVDYQVMVTAGRADGRLHIWAPASLPAGWRATSATSWVAGSDPHWALGATDGTYYLGIAEGLGDVKTQLGRVALNGAPVPSGEVTINGVVWSVFTDAHGGYALARTMPSKLPRYQESLVVMGTLAPQAVQTFAGSLTD